MNNKNLGIILLIIIIIAIIVSASLILTDGKILQPGGLALIGNNQIEVTEAAGAVVTNVHSGDLTYMVGLTTDDVDVQNDIITLEYFEDSGESLASVTFYPEDSGKRPHYETSVDSKGRNTVIFGTPIPEFRIVKTSKIEIMDENNTLLFSHTYHWAPQTPSDPYGLNYIID